MDVGNKSYGCWKYNFLFDLSGAEWPPSLPSSTRAWPPSLQIHCKWSVYQWPKLCTTQHCSMMISTLWLDYTVVLHVYWFEYLYSVHVHTYIHVHCIHVRVSVECIFYFPYNHSVSVFVFQLGDTYAYMYIHARTRDPNGSVQKMYM